MSFIFILVGFLILSHVTNWVGMLYKKALTVWVQKGGICFTSHKSKTCAKKANVFRVVHSDVSFVLLCSVLFLTVWRVSLLMMISWWYRAGRHDKTIEFKMIFEKWISSFKTVRWNWTATSVMYYLCTEIIN